jgi:protoheme IX farnesyltransferase
VTRFQRLVATTLATTFALVTIGVVVRATESGLACPHWPGCFEGQFLPSPADGYQVWLEWIHRTVAVVLGLLVLGVAVLAVLDHRSTRALLWPSLGAVALVGFQAWLGRETVRLGNSGESVTAHLAAALLLLGVLVFLLVRSHFPARFAGRGASQRFTLLAALGAATTFALLLFGSHVTATDTWHVFPDWPLMAGQLVPPLTEYTTPHALHRYAALVVWVIVTVVALVARLTQRERPWLVRLALATAILFPVQVVVGAAQIWTRLAPWAQTLHLVLGAAIWATTLGLALASYYTARTARVDAGALDRDRDGLQGRARPGPRSVRDTVRAYVALTKPRIIELLLVTTVPAMVLAAKGLPRLDLVWWTLVGGALAAGSANAINCYLDRDIDELMTRTRRRPLPAHEVEPDDALLFGVGLGVASFAVLAWFVNLLAAFLALLAIAFYVVVYTLLLKRSTPQNIVIGGAAGALPPVIGWAAVTGRVELPALLLFALVFYWTPPHFWALALRIRKDYAAAGVPMLPVVRGVAETARQIALYTVLLVAISFVFFAVARMGLVYFAAAAVLGAIFVWRALALWRQAASPEGTLSQAIRLYRYSITYLTLLFVAVAVDAVVADLPIR